MGAPHLSLVKSELLNADSNEISYNSSDDINNTTQNKTQQKMEKPSSQLTQNDLWMSHNSLRDEQHRNEDRLARQLSDSHATLQKQIADSESRIMTAISDIRSDIKHSETELRKDIRALNDKIDIKVSGLNNKIDEKVKGFATKSTIYTTGGIIVLALIVFGFIIVHFMPHLNMNEVKELIKFAIEESAKTNKTH